MRFTRKGVFLGLALLAAVLPASELYAPSFTVERVYYSDYFVTDCALEYSECGSDLITYGNPSCGLYRTVWVESCTGSIHMFSCHQKVDGEWVQIQCP